MNEKWHFDPFNGVITEGVEQVASVMPRNRQINGPLLAAAPQLLEALQKLLRQASTLEVLGEWEALDINSGLRKTTRIKVEDVIVAGWALVDALKQNKS